MWKDIKKSYEFFSSKTRSGESGTWLIMTKKAHRVSSLNYVNARHCNGKCKLR